MTKCKTCDWCEKPLPPHENKGIRTGRRRKFCSDNCRKYAHKHKVQLAWRG